ncbi:hypothetical protein CL634_03970 [bacterium]|nr:hypothetical protein [bacterium]|tara:strand:- start:1667 stop:2065 length:399 start_codon:yes stop_codon:yes gene_type:complete
MRLANRNSDFAKLLLRLGIAGVFLYFGINAVQNPVGQGAIWITPQIGSVLEGLISVSTFMMLFGIIQILIGALVLLGAAFKLATAAAAIALLGIVINLGSVSLNDIVYRDFALFTAALLLFFEGPGRYSMQR